MNVERYWSIAPLLLATAVRDRSQSLLLSDVGVKHEGGVLAWLLMSGKEKMLVDTGVCGVSASPKVLKRFTITPDQTLEVQLARFNTSLDEIEVVVNTHLHLDHCGGNVLLKNARFLVQKAEIEYARNPCPIHRPGYDVDLDNPNFDIIEGDFDAAPGVTLMLTPGHSPGSQTVCVQTREGLYIIAGDNIPTFDNMAVPEGASFWPNTIYVDLREYYRSLDRVKSLGGVILPGHDLGVLKKEIYP